MKVKSYALKLNEAGYPDPVTITTAYTKVENNIGKLLLPTRFLPIEHHGEHWESGRAAGDVGCLADGKIISSHIIKEAQPFLNAGSTVLDIGSHMGTMSMILSKCLSLVGGGNIVSIEASPQNFVCAKYNIEKNAAPGVNHTVHNYVCIEDSTAQPRVKFPVHEVPEFLSGQYSYISEGEYKSGEMVLHSKRVPIGSYYEVPTISVDALKLEKLDVIKIDCEGAEVGVVRGAAATIKKYKPAILVEVPDAPEARLEHLDKIFSIIPPGSRSRRCFGSSQGRTANDWLIWWPEKSV